MSSTRTLNTIIIVLVIIAIAVIALTVYLIPAKVLIGLAAICSMLALIGLFIMKVSR